MTTICVMPISALPISNTLSTAGILLMLWYLMLHFIYSNTPRYAPPTYAYSADTPLWIVSNNCISDKKTLFYYNCFRLNFLACTRRSFTAVCPWWTKWTIVLSADKVSLAFWVVVTVSLIDCTRCFNWTAFIIIDFTVTSFN